MTKVLLEDKDGAHLTRCGMCGATGLVNTPIQEAKATCPRCSGLGLVLVDKDGKRISKYGGGKD